MTTWKDWDAGDTVSDGEFQTLQNHIVNVYATTTERNAGAVTEGAIGVITGDNEVQIHNGSSWRKLFDYGANQVFLPTGDNDDYFDASDDTSLSYYSGGTERWRLTHANAMAFDGEDIYFGSAAGTGNDYITHDGANFDVVIDGTTEARFSLSGLAMDGVRITFGGVSSNDYLNYSDTTNRYVFVSDGATGTSRVEAGKLVAADTTAAPNFVNTTAATSGVGVNASGRTSIYFNGEERFAHTGSAFYMKLSAVVSPPSGTYYRMYISSGGTIMRASSSGA